MSQVEQQRERFTNQKRFVATAEDVGKKWGLSGKGFFCGLCGHRFAAGDGVRWVYANGNTPSYCNFFTCDSCDGPDVLERRTAAGNLAKSLDNDELVLAAELIKARVAAHAPTPAPQTDGWVSVEERLPDESGEYLVVEAGDAESFAADFFAPHPITAEELSRPKWTTVRSYGIDSEERELYNVTHWRPLPAPPQAGSEVTEEKE